MKKILILLAVLIGISANCLFAQSESKSLREIHLLYNEKHLSDEFGGVTETLSGINDPCYLKLRREGDDLILSLINFTPRYSYNKLFWVEGNIRILGNTISVSATSDCMQCGCVPDEPLPDYRYDLNLNLGKVSAGDILLMFDFQCRGIYSYEGLIPLKNEFLINSNIMSELNPIESARKEWVYYNNIYNGVEDNPLYRIRCANGKYNWLEVWLYDSPVFDKSKALDLLSVDTSGNFSIEGKIKNVDIPSTFWATNLPQPTYNPYIRYPQYYSSEIKQIEFKASPDVNFVSNCEGTSESPTTRYWWDIVNNEEKLMYVKDYGFKSENNTIEAVNLCENPDGSGYTAQWVSGIGPVGDNYASTLVYPVYNLPEGCEPTRLLYVRDLETNEVLWGDPTLDKYYLGVGEVEVEDTDTGYTVYTSNGICVLRNGEKSQYDTLPAGLYIVNGEKVIKK